MTTSSVVGSCPVSIVSATGQQFGIPLSILAVKDGAIDTSRLDSALASEASPVLQSLYRSGALVAGLASAPVVAFTLKAKAAGAAGNSIAVTIANVAADEANPEDTECDLTIDYEDRRSNLTPVSLGTQLGTPAGGVAPGLVALTAAATKLPGAMTATPLAAANPGDPVELAVPAEDGSGDAFTLQAVGTDSLLDDLTAAIEDVDTGTGTFTLVIALHHVETGIALSELDTMLGPLVDVEPGSGGFAPPAPGTIHLTGGAEAETSTPTAAEADVLSN